MTAKQDSIYIKACVIANGIRDQQGDVITKKDIKRIFTNSIDVGYDINHDNVRQEGIYSMEQYISKSEEKLGDCVVPSGSWMTVLRVDNKEVQEMIQKHEINGVSITAYPERGTTIKRSNPKVLLYKDIQEKDKIHPKEISLVERPSNQLPLEVMEYEAYLSKSVKENAQMTDTQNEKIMKQSTVSKVLDILQQIITPPVQKAEDDIQVELNVEPEHVEESSVESEETQTEEETEVETPEPEVEESEEEEEVEETPTEEEEEEEEEEASGVEKMMPPDQQMGMGGGIAEQALMQIAQICAKALQGQQQAQQPANQGNGIMQSEDPEPTEPIQKEEIEETPLQDKVTKKMDDEVVTKPEIDRAELFARQTGRDPITGEKL